MTLRSLGGAFVALWLTGCAAFAAKGDYADYREVLLADGERGRTLAMARYVKAHPNGKWANEVRAERQEAEPGLYESNKSTAEGLRLYLDAYPDGAYSEQARERLAALRTVEGRKDTETEAVRELRREERAGQAERRRTWATRAVAFWAKTLAGIENWGSPIAEVAKKNPEFNRAFGQNPRPRCSRTECIKFYQIGYAIPIPGATRVERKLEMLLRLRLEGGKVVRAEILMPDKGFSRWFEMENRTLLVDEDPGQRNEAITWVLERIVPALKASLGQKVETVDLVAEPIDPPKVRAPGQPDPGAALAPDEAAPAAEEAPPAAPTPPAPQDDDQLGELMEKAAGPGDESPLPTPTGSETPEEPETMTLPVAVQGFRKGNLEVGIFAASPEDYGRAYDGIYLEVQARRR